MSVFLGGNKVEIYVSQEAMVGVAGIEPATLCLEGRCSIP
jgi:hypothetical protein